MSTVPTMIAGAAGSSSHSRLSACAPRRVEIGTLLSSLTPSRFFNSAAGEVGIDLDADHMVCDLVPWERMVQRLGRVNRRGQGDATIVVVHGDEPKPKKPDAPTDQELRQALAFRSLPVLNELPNVETGRDASPGALR